MGQIKLLPAFIFCNGILLFFFVAAMGFYYRLVPEDYFAVSGNHLMGPWKQAVTVCNQWGGRFFSYLFSFILLTLVENGFSYAWYFLAGNLVLVFSFYSVLTYILDRYSTDFSSFEIFSFAVYAFICLFYLTPGIQESWFWVAASPSYYWGLVMAVAGLALLVRKKIKWLHIIISSCCFLYACSASEPFALMILFFFMAALYYNRKCKSALPVYHIAIPFIFAFAGFLIMYFSKGTQDRWLAMPDLTPAVKTKRLAGAVGRYYIHYFPVISILSFATAPVLIAAGARLRRLKIILPEIGFTLFCLLIFSAYTVMLLLGFLPSCFVMGEAGPLRSWHHIGIYNLIFSAVFFIFTGYYFSDKIKIRHSLLKAWLIMITFVHGAFLFQQLQVSRKYSLSVDKRIAFLHALNNKGFRGEATLDPLPASGYLFSAEIGADKNDPGNKFLKMGLELNFDIKVKDR
jgi:hypothetical protein